jgi:hypothetical protein
MSVGYAIILSLSTKGKLMSNQKVWEVACLFYEFCGSSLPEDEYDEYGDDWVCPECQDYIQGHYADTFTMSPEYDEGE